jgi:DeoR/GlpR family transcriptional regulator of sugar metabolism
VLAAQRRELILDALRTSRGAGVVQLAERLDVSKMTVRCSRVSRGSGS